MYNMTNFVGRCFLRRSIEADISSIVLDARLRGPVAGNAANWGDKMRARRATNGYENEHDVMLSYFKELIAFIKLFDNYADSEIYY